MRVAYEIGLFVYAELDYRTCFKTLLISQEISLLFSIGELYRFYLSMSLFRICEQTFSFERRPICYRLKI